MKRSILIVLGLIFLGFSANTIFAQQEQGMRKDMMKERMTERMKDKIADKLNLTDEQNNSIDELKFRHQKAMIPLKASVKEKEVEMNELKFKGNYTREQFISKVREINEIRDKIEIAQAEHQMDVYDLLNDEQKATWNKMKRNFGDHKHDMMEHRMDKRMGPPKDIE